VKTSTGTRRLSFSSLLAVTQIEEEEEEDADIREEQQRQCLCKHFKKWKKKWKGHHHKPPTPKRKKKKKNDRPAQKTRGEQTWLSHSLATHFSTYDELHESTKRAWVEAMEKTNVVAGTKVMEQGDTSGNYMYIVGTGFFDVYVDGQLVNTLGPGSLFGELALLFAAPRNATIVLKKDEEEERSSDDDSDDSDDSDDDQERPLVKNVLWRIHREKFIAVMHNDESDQGKYTFFVGLKSHSFSGDHNFFFLLQKNILFFSDKIFNILFFPDNIIFFS